MLYQKLDWPLRIMVISDAAFRREDRIGLAVRGGQICLGERHNGHPGERIHFVEYFSKKQRHIVRSTFGAELGSLSDSYEKSSRSVHLF